MGVFKRYVTDRLKEGEGLNSKEIAYIYGGGIIGALSPIVVGRYLLLPKSESIGQELFAWGMSTILNLSTMIFKPHLPIPAYTGLGGIGIGSLCAISSKRKRERKQRLEESILQIEDSLENPNADTFSKALGGLSIEGFKEAISNYRVNKRHMNFYGVKTKKYDDRVAELTKKFDNIVLN